MALSCAPACPVQAIVAGDDAEPKWTEVNANFEYTEEKRRSSKDDVTHGPNWDPDLA